MRGANEVDYWQRHYVIEQTLTAFFEFELKYPAIAEMARSGIINTRPDTGYVFKEGDGFADMFEGCFGGEPLSPEAEVQNQAWRDFVKTICGFFGQIFYASANVLCREGRESEVERALREHGEATITKIAAPYWKSLGRYGIYWVYGERLKELILEVVQRQANLEKLNSAQVETSNA